MNPEQSSKVYKVRRPDGQIWDIPEQNIDKAISLGGKVVNDFDNQPSPSNENPIQNQEKVFKVRRPDGQIWDIPEKNLEKAKAMGGTIVDEDPNYNDAGKTLARSAKTLGAAATGGLVDTATSIYNTPASLENAKTPEMKQNSPSSFVPESFVPEPSPYPDAQVPLIPSAEHAIESKIDEATGGYTKTANGDSTQAALRMVGAVASPGGLAKGAAKAGLKGATTVLAGLGTTKPVGLVGAGAAGAVSSEAEKAGYGGVASAALGLGAGAGVGAAAAVAKAFNTKLALAKLTGNSPKNIDLKAVQAFEEAGLPYTNNTVNESRGLALIDQGLSKTPFFGTRQARKLSANDQEYAKAVDGAIEQVGERIVKSENPSSLAIGDTVKDFFQDTKAYVVKTKNELYDIQAQLLPPDAQTVPSILSETIEKVRKTIKTLRPSTDETFLLKYLDEIENGFALKGTGTKTVVPVPVEMLVGTKRSINDIINWDVNASGVRNQLKQIQHAIQGELEIYGQTNPKWYESFKEADQFFGKRLGDKAFGSDTVQKKILAQENPEKIIGSLNDISDFKALEQSLNVTESGTKFFQSIKREKLSDLIMGKVINPTNESVNYSGFAKAMENPKTKELIKYLAGDNYTELQKFNEVAKAAVKRNARIPNPSGTAPTSAVINSILGAVTGTGGVVLGAATTAGNLVAGATAAYGLSWFLNNKSAFKWGIEAAKKQATGDIKAANIFSGRIERSMVNDLGDDFVRQFLALSSEK